MKIAIPLTNGILALHFGHCEQFALIDVDIHQKKLLQRIDLQAPPHQPGLLPTWLAERGANIILAGGMGQRARDLFEQRDIQVVVGVPSQEPESLVHDYLEGRLQTGVNLCDH
jgi:predicted Fe-Mo cluster-binding NifX family protein